MSETDRVVSRGDVGGWLERLDLCHRSMPLALSGNTRRRMADKQTDTQRELTGRHVALERREDANHAERACELEDLFM